MSKLKCFDGIKILTLEKQFKSLIKDDMTLSQEKKIGIQIAMDYYKTLNDDLNILKQEVEVEQTEIKDLLNPQPKGEASTGIGSVNKALSSVEGVYKALSEIDKVDSDSINKLMSLLNNDYSISSLANEVVSRSKIKFTPATDEQIRMVKEAKTPKEVLKLIIEHTTDPKLREVANIFFKNIHKVEPFLEFKIDLPIDRYGYPVGGDVIASYGGGKINVSEKAFWRKNNNYYNNGLDAGFHSIIHEFTHAFTLDAYRNPKTELEKQFKDYINKTYKELKRNSEFSDSYGFKSPEEFISEIISNPEFRFSAPIYKSGILDKIIEYIAKIFGYTKDKDAASDARFDKVQEAFDYILKSIPNIKAGKGKKTFYETTENLKRISEAYHKAKSDGSNPELVKAVEELLKLQPKEETSTGVEAKKDIKEPIKTLSDELNEIEGPLLTYDGKTAYDLFGNTDEMNEMDDNIMNQIAKDNTSLSNAENIKQNKKDC